MIKKITFNSKKTKEKELTYSIKMEVWVAVLKSGNKEKKQIIIVFVLMMRQCLKSNNRILISPLKLLKNLYAINNTFIQIKQTQIFYKIIIIINKMKFLMLHKYLKDLKEKQGFLEIASMIKVVFQLIIVEELQVIKKELKNQSMEKVTSLNKIKHRLYLIKIHF